MLKIAALCSTFALVVMVGSAAAQRAPSGRPDPLPPRPLANLAARRVLVLPAHYIRPGDELGWAARITNRVDYLGNLDAEIAFALGNRGVKKLWVFAPALARVAKRNPTYAPDPYDLAAQWLRPPLRRTPDLLPEPFASQLRTLVALEEGAEYVLFPVEIRFERVAKDERGDRRATAADTVAERAIVRVVVLDARRSSIVWMGDVASDPAAAFSPMLATSVAEHLADLIAAP